MITQSCGNHQSDCPAPPIDPTLSNGTVSPTDLSPVQPWPVGLKPVCSACAQICPNKRKREIGEKTGNEWGNQKRVIGVCPLYSLVVPCSPLASASGGQGKTREDVWPGKNERKKSSQEREQGKTREKAMEFTREKATGFTRGCARLAWRQDARCFTARSVCRVLEASLCSAGSVLRVPPLSALVYTVYSALCNLYCCIMHCAIYCCIVYSV